MSLTSAKRLSDIITGVWQLFSKTKATNSSSRAFLLQGDSQCVASDSTFVCTHSHHTNSAMIAFQPTHTLTLLLTVQACQSRVSTSQTEVLVSALTLHENNLLQVLFLQPETSSTRLSSTAGCFPFLLYLRRQICHIWRPHVAEKPVEPSTSSRSH